MNMDNGDADEKQRLPLAVPFYYGWFVVALSFLANLTAAGIRSAPSVLIHPLEAEFGWTRAAIASAASLNLLLLGLFAPAGGWLIDRFGARRVILGSLTTIAVGLNGVILVQQLWQLILVCGVVLGIATGITPALGASIAARWFVDRRGLAVGHHDQCRRRRTNCFSAVVDVRHPRHGLAQRVDDDYDDGNIADPGNLVLDAR